MNGIYPTDAEAEKQLRELREGIKPLHLKQHALIGAGVVRFSPQDLRLHAQYYEKRLSGLRVGIFIPASGLGTRLFQPLARMRRLPEADRETRTLLDSFLRLPFARPLDQYLQSEGKQLKELLRQKDIETLVARLIEKPGLGYGKLAKWDLPFHVYDQEVRLCWKEHAYEALHYAVGKGNGFYLHATLRPEVTMAALARYQAGYQSLAKEKGIDIQFSSSVQDPCTHTLAIYTADASVVRTSKGGGYYWRPSGHGALVSNLASFAKQVEVLFIKNVDGTPAMRYHKKDADWKKALAGYALRLRDQGIKLQEGLAVRRPSPEAMAAANLFLRGTLCVSPPQGAYHNAATERDYLIDRLQRPLRVCGMVRTDNAQGGAPFFCRQADGTTSLQIVESAQIDYSDPAQGQLFRKATFFNPVNMVCLMKDKEGKPFDLNRYVDEKAKFITEKTHKGRGIYALERAGLWNGGMSGWNTAFVEVPKEMFSPVKTLLDLLAPRHQVD